ncbi:MAG: RNA polymerase sigma factor [Solibacillus sp.]
MELEEIIMRVQRGESQYYTYIIKRYEQKVFITAKRLVKNHTTAEDLVQDSFIKGFYSLHKYKNTGSFNAWLYRIVVNNCFDYLRKAKLQFTQTEAETTDHSSPEKIVLLHERNEQLEQLLGQLNELDYTVLLLKYVNGLSYDEISEVLDISLNDVRNKLHRSKKQLKTMANKKGGYFYEM